jgi:hypothetical protein
MKIVNDETVRETQVRIDERLRWAKIINDLHEKRHREKKLEYIELGIVHEALSHDDTTFISDDDSDVNPTRNELRAFFTGHCSMNVRCGTCHRIDKWLTEIGIAP